MVTTQQAKRPKILIMAATACAYPGADSVGRNHVEYPTNAYLIRVPAPVIFPESFYFRCFDRGIDGIIVMTCGHECPYPGAYNRFTQRIAKVHRLMKERGMDINRLRICAICTVCVKPFVKEIGQMNQLLAGSR
jgi:F420-non-reducing hydrogenase iron-sulfur subunit